MNKNIVVITGANSGLGFQAARQLSLSGFRVIFACRNQQKAEHAIKQLKSKIATADVEFIHLDLANLISISEFVENLKKQTSHINCLINNAGLMRIPFCTTVDGYEMQMGVNHLGHFALTCQLLPLLANSPNTARVVTLSSIAQARGKINLDNLVEGQDYERWQAYRNSKLANIMFAYELQRKFDKHGLNAKSIPVHPGLTRTNITDKAAEMDGSKLQKYFGKIILNLLGQSVTNGAKSTIFAVTNNSAEGGKFYGPLNFFKMKGKVGEQESSPLSYDAERATKLWELSAKLTNCNFVL